ncbi:hypothetical protein D6855_14030 [Butyrivibrio sp. CB08]|uniref:hypothetical protein n=1 Tax=Butyrivibrio sp. CB08 TaxID=2364879 RepID=UPI000EA87FB4|nr:hypothetical protein [Butyrivibrio sp. CB08]RKM56785.1 hypothetical protein D6855_14030 [Butyrivibrio sp. CB08]
MTDEQKTRIRQAEPNDCEFDGMPMHPHYRHFLICAGFKDLCEVESKTEEEFIEIMNNAKNRAGQPLSHMNNLGNTMVRNLKKYGLVFKENEDL